VVERVSGFTLTSGKYGSGVTLPLLADNGFYFDVVIKRTSSVCVSTIQLVGGKLPNPQKPISSSTALPAAAITSRKDIARARFLPPPPWLSACQLLLRWC